MKDYLSFFYPVISKASENTHFLSFKEKVPLVSAPVLTVVQISMGSVLLRTKEKEGLGGVDE